MQYKPLMIHFLICESLTDVVFSAFSGNCLGPCWQWLVPAVLWAFLAEDAEYGMKVWEGIAGKVDECLCMCVNASTEKKNPCRAGLQLAERNHWGITVISTLVRAVILNMNKLSDTTRRGKSHRCLALYNITLNFKLLTFHSICQHERLFTLTFFSAPSCRMWVWPSCWISKCLPPEPCCSSKSGGGDTLRPWGSTHVYTWLVT